VTPIDRGAVLDAFDRQIRRQPAADSPGGWVERDDRIVRRGGHGWAGVTWSDLDELSADEVIAAQIDRFAGTCGRWEWKHYSYDEPADLVDRLTAAGFTPEPAEALLVAEIADLKLDVAAPPGVELRAVRDPAGVAALVSVHDQVFGEDHASIGETLLADLAAQPARIAAVVAFAGGVPVSAGRVELPADADFASLWGGGTLPGWRGRGVFRSLVAHRAAIAATAGYRYLQVDAMPDSRPILKRLGFVELAMTTPFVYPGEAG
jgi:GNAT superfamily N-acetyltransferase